MSERDGATLDHVMSELRAAAPSAHHPTDDPFVQRAWAATLFVDGKGDVGRARAHEVGMVADSDAEAAARYLMPDVVLSEEDRSAGASSSSSPSSSHHELTLTDVAASHIIAFRTTMSLSDVMHDLDLRMTPFLPGMRVHRGIFRKYLALRGALHVLVRTHAPQNLLLTGHSLGGALACMAAVDLRAHFDGVELHVVTFGSPRVGDEGFARALLQSCSTYVRVQDPRDIIPTVPGRALGFRHGGLDQDATENRSGPSPVTSEQRRPSVSTRGFVGPYGPKTSHSDSTPPRASDWSDPFKARQGRRKVVEITTLRATPGRRDEAAPGTLGSAANMGALVLNSFLAFLSSPTRHHFFHLEPFYEQSMRTRSAVVHVMKRIRDQVRIRVHLPRVSVST
jgi:hypothetical protein